MSTTLLAVILAQAAASIPSSAPAVTPVAAKGDRTQRVVCHSEEVTGSLAGHRRVCHTVAEWEQLHENSVGVGNDLVDHSLIVAGNGH